MSKRAPFTPRPAQIELDGWAGRWAVKCVVYGETPTRYRVRLTESGKMAGRHKYGEAGSRWLVPKDAITFLGNGLPADRAGKDSR